ncbi:MAG: hypothetical protein HY326_11440 [Chloroflexi bacterium]|nr:hypothetical protein [Chloroflexota bacterium]
MESKQSWKRLGQIFPCTPADVWDRDPSAPHVLRLGDRLRMYYHGRQGQLIRIGLAEAPLSDPLAWRKYSGQPVLDLGPPGSIDSHWAGYPWVVPITGTHWHMYYAGWGGQFDPNISYRKIWGTTLAESDDGGLTWQRAGRLLFQPGRPYAPDAHGSGSCAVLPVGNEYWMWYTAINQPRPDFYRISVALAVSTDGGHTFTPHPAGGLVNLPPQVGKLGSTCSKPCVDFTGGRFRMWFSVAQDGQNYRIHYAESPDGIYFNWLPEPVLDVSLSGWDHIMTCYPSVLSLEDRTLMFYDGDTYAGIGVAEMVKE